MIFNRGNDTVNIIILIFIKKQTKKMMARRFLKCVEQDVQTRSQLCSTTVF